MELTKPVLRSWYSTPALNSPWNDIKSPGHDSLQGSTPVSAQNTAVHSPSSCSLPGVASFLSPQALNIALPTSYTNGGPWLSSGRAANTIDSVTGTSYAAVRVARAPANSYAQKPRNVPGVDSQDVVSYFPARTPTNSPLKSPLNIPKSNNAEVVPAEVRLAKASPNLWSKQPHFRPVGVVTKRNKPPGTAPFISSSHPMAGPPRCAHPAYMFHAPLPAGPHWTTNSAHGAKATHWTSPDYHNNPNFKVYPYCQPYQARLGYHDSHVRRNKHTMSCSEDYPIGEVVYSNGGTKVTPPLIQNTYKGQDHPHYAGYAKLPSSLHSASAVSSYPLQDTKSDVKMDLHMLSSGECLNKNVSVVTLRAHDTSLYVANNVGTTSQTESEFTLHDAKMQLTEPVPEPPSPQTSSSLLCSLLQSPGNGSMGNTHYITQSAPDEVKYSQPGLEMLSDVSLLVESMTSQIANEKSNSSQHLACRTTMSDQPTTVRGSNTGLCPPQATFIGTIQSYPDSTSVHTSPSDDVLLNDGTDYTDLSPSTLLQDEHYPLSDDLDSVEALKEIHTTLLPPKKSARFTTTTLSCEDLSEDSAQLLLKLSKAITQQTMKTPSLRGRPSVRAGGSDIGITKTHDNTTTKRERPKKLQQPGQTSSHVVNQKRKQRNKENVCEIKAHLQDDLAFESQEINNLEKNVPITHFTTESYESISKVHMEFPPHSSHEDQLSCLTKTGLPALQQHTGSPAAAEYCGWEMGDCQNDATFLSTEVIEVPADSDADDTEGTQETVTVSEDYDLISKEFDPLVIAEEEVTSTQPHEEEAVQQDGVKQEGDIIIRDSKLRQRSHICVSCFTYPSSSDDSDPQSAGYTSCSHSSKWNPGKGRKTPCGKTSKQRSTDTTDELDLGCHVCGRRLSSLNNLTRHKRQFHPSLFLGDTGIVELPLVSYRSMLPLSPSSISSVKSPKNSMTRSSRLTSNPKPLARTPNKTPDLAADGRSPYKRKPKRKAIHSDDEMWQPESERPKKKKKRKKAVVPQTQTRAVSGGGGDGTDTQVVQRRRRRRRRQANKAEGVRRQTRACTYQSSYKTKTRINFRTKKRTRINSTIPCPYCERLFSVMSNLKRHTKREHQDVYVFVCSVCGDKYSMRRTLKKHIKKEHARDFPFCCPECLTSFVSEVEMMTHRQCHVVPRFPCDDCRLTFYTEDHLSEHLAAYHVSVNVPS